MKLFEHKPFDARAVMGFGVLNGCSIGLLNLSLGFNSVGFYQVATFYWFSDCLLLNHLLNDISSLLAWDNYFWIHCSF